MYDGGWHEEKRKSIGDGIAAYHDDCFSVVSDAAMVKADELLIKLHYHRADDNYDGWDVWMWGEGADGAAYDWQRKMVTMWQPWK